MTDYSQMSDQEINQEVTCIINQDAQKMALIGDGSCFYDCGPDGNGFYEIPVLDYCNSPEDAWPIIGEHKISTMWMTAEKEWCAWAQGDLEEGTWDWENVPDYYFNCESQLRAAMIVFLKMRDFSNANPI